MKKIFFKTAAILLIMAGVISSCGKKDSALTGTVWRLEGFADAQSGVLEKVVPRKGVLADVDGWLKLIDGEPFDCAECYTLTFISDYVMEGRTILNHIWVAFFVPVQISSTNISFSEKPGVGGTEVGEPPTPTRYRDALADLTSYICCNNELKLFYSSNENYLLFKLVQQ